MNFVFICGSLEMGKDGVGDYTRLFSSHLKKLGHQASIIAYNDRYSKSSIEQVQHIQNQPITILRLPATFTNASKILLAQQFIIEQDPQFLSLQFVPFAFQEKGLPIDLAKNLRKIASGKEWHIMCHELWVGMNKQASFKMKLWGFIQKQILGHLIRSLKPIQIHTQSQLYLHKIKNLGFLAHHLPIFSNIIRENASQSSQVHDIVRYVIFGAIRPNVPIEMLINEIKKHALDTEKGMQLIIVGKAGPEQEKWKRLWENSGADVEVCGEQPMEQVSQILSRADIGLVTTPLLLIEKSGTAAALREHGLPVICLANDWSLKKKIPFKTPDGIYNYTPNNFATLIERIQPAKNYPTLENVVDKFLKDIK